MVLLVLATTSLASAASGSGHGIQADSDRGVRARAAALQGLTTLAPAIAALRTTRTVHDAVDTALTHSLLLSDGVAAQGLSRRVGFTRPVWFLPATDGQAICVLTLHSLNCPPISEVTQDGLAPSVSWSAHDPVRISGIATDDIEEVDVTMADGTVRQVPITNNLLDFTGSPEPREVEWDGPNGPDRFVLPRIPRH